jgi:hypothetical protein
MIKVVVSEHLLVELLLQVLLLLQKVVLLFLLDLLLPY